MATDNEFNPNHKEEDNLAAPSGIITNPLKLFLVCLGLVLAIFMAALDETIVATAMGAMTSHFKAQQESAWISGSYLLTISASTPLYGKFSDIFGRKNLMLFALFIFLLGSALCGFANSIEMLIVSRGLAGIGAGGLIALSFIIISDVVPIDKRSMYLSLLNATFAFANVFGPLLGGLISDTIGWPWVFFINLPIIPICIAVVFFFTPKQPSSNIRQKLKRVDFIGTGLLLFGILLFTLAMNFAGKLFEWKSAEFICIMAASLVLLAVFIWVELQVAIEPVIPVHAFNRNVILSSLASLLSGFVMFVFIYHWPLYYETVHQSSNFRAGIELLPVILGTCVFAAISGMLVTYLKVYRPFLWLGMLLTLVACSFLFRLSKDMSRVEHIIYPLLAGTGVGLCVQTVIITAQVASDEKNQAAITGFLTFCLNIGGVLGLTILGAILNMCLKSNLLSYFSQDTVTLITNSIDFMHSLNHQDKAHAVLAYSQAYNTMFLFLIPVSAVGLILVLFLKDIPITHPSTSH